MTAFRPRAWRAAAGFAPMIALVAALGATAAGAQTPPPAGAHPDREARRAEMRQHMEQRHQAMIADWTTVLRLTPAQAQALSAAMTRPPHDDMKRGEHKPGEMAGETTLQRLDKMQARMTEREGRMRAHLQAMRSFYTSLSPEQQKVFDAMTRLSHHGMGGRGHGGHGGWGHHGGWGGRMGEGGPMGGQGGPGGGRGHRGPPPPTGE